MHFLRNGSESIFVCLVRGASSYVDGRFSWQKKAKRSIYGEMMDFPRQVLARSLLI